MARTTPVNAGYTIINGSTSGSNGYRTDTWIEYKVVSQSVTNNTSTVHVFLYSAATFSSTTQYTTPAEYGYVGYDNGNKQYLSTAYDFRNYRVNKFAEYTYTIAHNSDGKKSITLQGAWNTSHSSYISGGNVSGVVNLPQIARASTIGNVSGNFGARVSIPINRQDASFTHTIEYAFGTLSGTIATQTADASVNWIVPASLISQIPNAKNGVGVVTIRTYSGGAQIGTSSASLLLSIANTTLAPVSVQAGVQTTLTATNSAGNELTYNYRYVFGDTESTISGSTSSTTYTFPIELIAQFSGVSGNGTLYVDTYNNDVFINTATASLTITLPLITAANVTATMGMQTSIALTRVYAPLTATVTATVSGNTYTLATQTTDSTIYWTPNASIADSVPNANNAVGTVTVTTYHAGVVAGSNQYNLILIVPTGNPTVSTTLTYVNSNSTIDGWNELVQGYSALQIDATASALYGSTISSLSMQGDGLGATSSPNTSPASISGVSSVFATDGTFTYTSNATDGRGRSTSASDIVTVYPYAKPTLTNVSIYRANSSGVADPAGTELGMTFTSGYSSVNGKNSATVYLEYRLAEDNTYNTYGAVTSGDVTSLPIRVDKNYVTRLRIVDGLNTVYSAAVNIPTAERVMNVNASGKGLAIGKMSEKNAFEVAWDAFFKTRPKVGENEEEVALIGDVGGFVTVVTTANTNLNDYTQNGWYFFGTDVTPVNIPTGSDGWLYVVSNVGTNEVEYYKQLWFRKGTENTNDYETYLRTGSTNTEGVWSDWAKNLTNKETILRPTAIEMRTSTSEGHGGFIDFHYNGSTSDYTSRIVEYDSGVLTLTPSINVPGNISIGGARIADFVTDQGTSGNWMFRAWNSGLLEQWGYGTVTGKAATTAWGGIYATSSSSPAIVPGNYLVGFTSAPMVQLTLEGINSGDCWAITSVGGTATTAPQYRLGRGTSSSTLGVKYSIYAVGRWR